MSDNSLLFAQQIARRAVAKAAKEQAAAWNMRHAAHGHELTDAINVECDHELALCYIYEPPPQVGEMVEILATGEFAMVERVFSRPGAKGYGVKLSGSGAQTWIKIDGVRKAA